MNTNIITSFDWFALLSLILITVMSLYQACINLFYGKVSRFSIDAILVFLLIKFGNEKTRKRARAFTKNTQRIFLLGVYALLTFIGGIYGIIVWLRILSE